MDRTGLASAGDDLGARWVAVRHADDHVHIVATLARQDGRRPKLWNDFYRIREACLEAEQRFGLTGTAPADRTAARRPARAETEQAAARATMTRRLPAARAADQRANQASNGQQPGHRRGRAPRRRHRDRGDRQHRGAHAHTGVERDAVAEVSRPALSTAVSRALLVATTAVGGLMGGLLDRAVVATPAWRQLGAHAWAAYSRHADLGNGRILYPLGYIGLAVLAVAAALTVRVDRTAPRAVAVPVHLQAVFMLAVMALTVKAAPIMDSTVHRTGAGQLRQAFGQFTPWGIYLRGAAVMLTLLSSFWALVALSRTPEQPAPPSTPRRTPPKACRAGENRRAGAVTSRASPRQLEQPDGAEDGSGRTARPRSC